MMSDGPNAGAKWSKYSVEDGTLVRKAEFCPEFGPGIFLASHSDRKTCGRCGFTQKSE